jgi:hypothetical protein
MDSTINEVGIVRMGDQFFMALPVATVTLSKGAIMYPREVIFGERANHVWWYHNDYKAICQYEALCEELADIWCEAHSYDRPIFEGKDWKDCARKVTTLHSQPMTNQLLLDATMNGSKVLQTARRISWHTQVPNNAAAVLGRPDDKVWFTYGERNHNLTLELENTVLTATYTNGASNTTTVPWKLPTPNQWNHHDNSMEEIVTDDSVAMLGPISKSMNVLYWDLAFEVVEAMAREIAETKKDLQRLDSEELCGMHLDPNFNIDFPTSAPIGCALREGNKIQQSVLNLVQGTSKLFLGSHVHARAGLSPSERDANNRLHIVLYNSRKSKFPIPRSQFRTTQAHFASPVLKDLCAHSSGGYHRL